MSRIAFAGRDTRKRPSAESPRKELTSGTAEMTEQRCGIADEGVIRRNRRNDRAKRGTEGRGTVQGAALKKGGAARNETWSGGLECAAQGAKHTIASGVNPIYTLFTEADGDRLLPLLLDIFNAQAIGGLGIFQEGAAGVDRLRSFYINDVEVQEGELVQVNAALLSRASASRVYLMAHHEAAISQHPDSDYIPAIPEGTTHIEMLQAHKVCFLPFEFVPLVLCRGLTPKQAFQVLQPHIHQQGLVDICKPLLDTLQAVGTQPTTLLGAIRLLEPGPSFRAKTSLRAYMKKNVFLRDRPGLGPAPADPTLTAAFTALTDQQLRMSESLDQRRQESSKLHSLREVWGPLYAERLLLLCGNRNNTMRSVITSMKAKCKPPIKRPDGHERCHSWHVRGNCFTGCRHLYDHSATTSEEQDRLWDKLQRRGAEPPLLTRFAMGATPHPSSQRLHRSAAHPSLQLAKRTPGFTSPSLRFATQATSLRPAKLTTSVPSTPQLPQPSTHPFAFPAIPTPTASPQPFPIPAVPTPPANSSPPPPARLPPSPPRPPSPFPSPPTPPPTSIPTPTRPSTMLASPPSNTLASPAPAPPAVPVHPNPSTTLCNTLGVEFE
eukprot:jgi/Psemu1/33358/gm1.33358_g